MIKLRFASPLDKFLPRHTMADVSNFETFPILTGETFAVHAVFADDGSFLKTPVTARVTCDGGAVKVYRVDSVPVRVPCYPEWNDDDYMTKEPFICPDVLCEICEDTLLYAPQRGLTMLRIEVSGLSAGEHSLTVTLESMDAQAPLTVSESISFTVLETALPKQRTTVMQILHADCIASYYKVAPLSDRHFELVEKWVRTAVENGINALYTPVFTPPMDTAVGGERPTVQLTGVSLRDGKWSFSFDLLDRWCDMALGAGVEYFEISHLFTQWGAYHAPKVVAEVDGEIKKVFGWETDAAGEEYVTFIREFLTEFLAHMKKRGLDKRCIFHVSDEPSESQIESYLSATRAVSDILADYVVADALSDVRYYTEGICKDPIPGTDHAEDFLEHIPEGLWVYYCCSQSTGVSNRYMAMPLSRVRVIGAQMWKAKAMGFLHWGYNFYFSQYSRYAVDPYKVTDGDYFAPAGDAFSVYPSEDGSAVASIRLRTFYEALCDIRALEAAEAKVGRAAVEAIVDDGIEGGLTFTRYPRGREYIENLRRKIAEILE